MKSFVQVSANSDFPIENLPYGVFRKKGVSDANAHIGVAIGDYILDLHQLASSQYTQNFFKGHESIRNAFCKEVLNDFMELERCDWQAARRILQNLLDVKNSTLQNSEMFERFFVRQDSVQMLLPVKIGDYTDFYSSRNHATNVGIMFRGKDNALQPNWLHLPVGYHGRSSSVVVSGTDIRRPKGQVRMVEDKPPTYSTCKLLDFELEMAFFVGGKANPLGTPIDISKADDRLFGLVLMNDWSARDIQKQEYVPLGPFNGKNFATTISPQIVTMEALEPYKIKAEEPQDPSPLPYLNEQVQHLYDIQLDVSIQPENCPKEAVVAKTNSCYLYQSFKQQLVHHSSTGCPMKAGDLCGTGTISGPDVGSYGSMLEISWKGTRTIKMPDESERKFLKDGDKVNMRGYCSGDGKPRIGFGLCSGKILPAFN